MRATALRALRMLRTPRPTRTVIAAAALVATVAASSTVLSPQQPLNQPSQQAPKITLPLNTLDPPQYGDANALQAALTEIRAALPDPTTQVATDADSLAATASTPWSASEDVPGAHHAAIVRPRSTEDVAAIVRACARYRVPVIASAGRTALEGHCAPTRAGLSICIDITGMNRVIAIHDADLDVVVQPGVVLDDLDTMLRERGLMLGIDPGPGAMVGGGIATSCSGPRAVRTGTMRDNVLALTAVLADGSIITTKHRVPKSSAGYALTQLLVGSEGTLAIVTEATLKVHVRPTVERVVVASFPSVANAAAACAAVVRHGLHPYALELVDDGMMACINACGGVARTYDELPTIFVRLGAHNEQEVTDSIAQLKEVCNESKVSTFAAATNEIEAKQLWDARRVALWSTLNYGQENIASDIRVWTTDVAVPVSQLPTLLSEAKQRVRESGLYATFVGHAGDGNFHAFLLYREDDRSKAKSVVDFMVHRALELEGTCTGEHGVGYGKRQYLVDEKGQPTVDLMRKIKIAFDPNRILNPDKIFKTDPNDTWEE